MMRLLLITILLASPIWSVNAATIYVSKAGSNTSPYDTWAKASTTPNRTVAAGDTVLIGAGTYYNVNIVFPTGSTAADPTHILDSAYVDNGSTGYGSSILNAGDTIPKASWAVLSGNVYVASYTPTNTFNVAGYGAEDIFTLSQNDVLLTPVLEGDDSSAVNAAGEFFYNPVTHRMFIYCVGSVNPNTVTIEASAGVPFHFTSDDMNHIHVAGVHGKMGKQGVVRTDSDDAPDSVFFDWCKLTHVSFTTNENPAIVHFHGDGGGVWDSSGAWTNTYARFFEFNNCSLGVGMGTGTEAHQGSGVVSYNATNIRFANSHFYNLISDGCEIKNSESGDGQVAAQFTFANCTFENIGQHGVNIYTNAHRDSVYGCVFDSIGLAAIGIGQSSPGNDDRGDHFICNNTFYKCNQTLKVRPNEDVPRDYAPYTGEFKYNVVYDKVPLASDLGTFPSIEHSFMFDLAGATVPLDIWIDSNQYYDPDTVFIATWGSTTTRDWTYWQGTADNDSNGLNTDPGLNTTTFATTSAGTMSRTYGGQDWTVWGAIQPDVESCIVITALPDTLDVADTCYCLQDRKMSTTGNALLINARNVRLINRYGTRDTLDFGTDGGNNYEGLYITGKNVKVDGLYIRHYPTDPADSAANNICVFAVNADSLKVFRTKLFTAGTSGRGIQTNSGGFNIDLWRVTQDSSRVNSFISRTAHSANIFLMVPDSTDGFTNYFFNAHACSVYNAPHNILATSDGPRSRPLVYIDSCDFSVDARNDFYTYDDHDNNTSFSSGDAFAIDVLGMGPGSRISYNRIRSGTAHEGGQGMLLQNLMGSSDDSIKIFGNDVDVSQGPNEIHGMGLCAGMYFRYVPGTENSGSQYVAVRNNTWKVTLDCDTATAYRGREGETWSLNISGFGGGVNDGDSFRYIDFTNNVVEQAFSGTPDGGWEGSAIGYGSADSADAAYNRNGHVVFKNNHYKGVRQAVEIGNMRGLPGNRWTSIGDTIELSQDSDSAVCFDRTGTYTYHSRYNRIINAIYAGYADDANIRFDVGNGTSNDTLGEGISFWKTLTSIVTTCTDNTVVNGASYWVWNTYGDTVLTGTTGADGVITGLVNYKFEGYDKIVDTYSFADSTYSDFTIKAKSGDDSVQVTMTVAAASLTQSDSLCFLTLAAGDPSVTTIMRGITLQGVTIK